MPPLAPLSRVAAAGALALLLAPPVAAQTVDLRAGRVDLIQTIQTGNTPLYAGRPTFARAHVGVSQGVAPVLVDGILRVYADGEEIPGSPIFSDNGPFPAGLFTNLEQEDATLNFVFIPPATSDLVVEFELNPPGPNFVEETSFANNGFTVPSQVVEELAVADMVYVPVDYRPGGGSVPNLPDPELIRPGVGDNFIQAIFPGGLIEYRLVDAGSKLWTDSVSGTGSVLNSSLASDLALMSPQPDFIYGWIPGAIPYNGQAQLPGVAAMGNTQPIRHQRTYAHEVGHNTSLFHNSTQVATVGVDVEHHLNLTESLPQIKASGLNDIMVPGLLTPQAWVSLGSYLNFANHPAWDAGADADALLAGEPGPRLLVSGLWNRETGALELDPVVELPGGRLTPAAQPGARDLLLRGLVAGEPARELPLTVRTSLDECPECRAAAGDGDAADSDSAAAPSPLVGFAAVLPARAPSGAPLERLELVGLGSHPVQPALVERTAHAPEVRFTAPASTANVGATLTLAWSGHDADGDALHYVLRYVPDGADHIVPLLDRTTATSHVVDLSRLPHFEAGAGYFELLATDGLNTARTRTDALHGPGAYLGSAGNPPAVEIYHPDDGFSFLKGANVVLHSAGWDREDLSLQGDRIAWRSDVDGELGTGRRLVVSDLSPGAHVITVAATDSGGLTTERSAAITVIDRGLPSVGEVVCASDVGFGGPGVAQLSLCGTDLTAGGSAELLLTGAAPNSAAFLALGLAANPTPVKGGTLVPFPWAVLDARMTDGDGEISTPNVMGSGMPATFFVQYVIVDPSQPLGFDFSNALFVEF